MKTLATIQQEFRDLVAQGTDLVLAALKKALRPGTDCYDDYFSLEGRYQDLSRQLLQGIVSNEDATLEFNRIRLALIEFIGNLKESDLLELAKEDTATSGMADVYNGEVLYRIPKKMQLGIESECVIRLAFDRKTILHDFQVQIGDVMKDLRISDVMGVELLDPNADKAFSITTVNDTVQFVDKGLVTEWIFCVTPLKEGQFPLVLKISIIEIINGIERKRNEVLKEQVEILTQLPVEATTAFVSAGYSWQLTQTDEQRAMPGAGGSKAFEPAAEAVRPSPSVPQPVPMPRPQAPVPANSGGFKKIGTILGALAALVFCVFAMKTFLGENSGEKTPDVAFIEDDPEWQAVSKRRDRKELEDFIEKYPGTNESAKALNILDTLEEQTWQQALAINDVEAMNKYLLEYPAGKYVDSATLRLWELEYDWSEPNLAPIADSTSTRPLTPEPTNENGKNLKPAQPKRKSGEVSKPAKKAPKNQTKTSNSPVKPTTDDKPNKPPADPNMPVILRATARKPVFRGCEDKDLVKEEKCSLEGLQKFLSKGLQYPQAALMKSIEGTVNVSFVVEKDGSINEVHATNDIGGGCAAEAERLIKKLPKFKPGLNARGTPVRVLYNQPIRFKLQR